MIGLLPLRREELAQPNGPFSQLLPQLGGVDLVGREAKRTPLPQILVPSCQILLALRPFLFHLVGIGDDEHGLFKVMSEGNKPVLLEERQEGKIRGNPGFERGAVFFSAKPRRRAAVLLSSLSPFLQEAGASGKFAQGRDDDPGDPAR
jgi:hypothetical protein